MISLILPTRGRPHKARRFITSALTKADQPDHIEFIVGVDEDDRTMDDFYADLILAGHEDQIRLITRPRHTTLGALTDSLHRFARGGIIGWAADDVEIETLGWDTRTREAVTGQGIFHPAFGGNESFCFAPFFTADFAERLREAQGFICPPYFPFWFNDTWFDELGDLLGEKHFMPWSYAPQAGPSLTYSLRDIPFWAEVFDVTRPERVRAAIALSDLDPSIIQARADSMSTRQSILKDKAFAARYANAAELEPNPRYEEAKRHAELLLR